MKFFRQRCGFTSPSLIQLTFVLLLIFIMPGIVMAAIYRQSNGTSEVDIDDRIRELDLHIAKSVQSPFYLSRIDPCSGKAKDLLKFEGNVEFQITDVNELNTGCQWSYSITDVEEASVTDEWSFVRSTWFIVRRSYALNGQAMVTDHFDPIDSACFKRRVYEQMERDAICFPESGIVGSLRSPIPPSFYWFFYR